MLFSKSIYFGFSLDRENSQQQQTLKIFLDTRFSNNYKLKIFHQPLNRKTFELTMFYRQKVSVSYWANKFSYAETSE